MAESQVPTCMEISTEDLREVFKFLTAEDIENLCPYLELREWPAEAVLMEEGKPGAFLGFLLSGRLAVKKETMFPGKHILMAILEKGAMVGETSVIDGGERNATVTAMDDVVMFVLTTEKMNTLLEEQPHLGVKLLKRILRIVTLRFRKASDRLARLL